MSFAFLLQLGDPTSSPNFEPCPILVPQQQSDTSHMWLQTTAGYVNALGTHRLRQAIAHHHSQWHLDTTTTASTRHGGGGGGGGGELVRVPGRPVSANQVVVASGCSGALDLALRALLDPGTYLLVPNPGFPLYQVIAESMGAHVLPYRLLPDQEWQVDLDHVQTLVQGHDEQVVGPIRGMVVNNPSNPTGAVYSCKHLRQIVDTCQVCRMPIVADEIYGDLTYLPSRPFIPLANVAAAAAPYPPNNHHTGPETLPTASVPVITCSGIGKQFLVPGWRVGWAVFYDNVHQSLAPVEHGAKQLAQIVLGASHPAQAMAVQILTAATVSSSSSSSSSSVEMTTWQVGMRQTLRDNAKLLGKELANAPGLVVSNAQGAMYSMVRFDPSSFDFLNKSWSLLEEDPSQSQPQKLDHDTTPGEEWSRRLLQEENVFVLPGSCFGIPNAFRLVFCAPAPTLQTATQRIVEFCKRHYIGP